MLEIMTSEASKGSKNKARDRTIKYDKYVQMKRFNNDQHLQFYMYDFMYVDTDTITEEEYFSSTRNIFENYKKMSTPGPVPKYWILFCYIFQKIISWI